jgi:hypothetical protein
MIPGAGLKIRSASAMLGVALFAMVQVGFGQSPPPPGQAPAQPAAALLSPEQLDNLVAPVALYPDPLLGQVMAASTYPLEIVEAQRWLQQNRNLQGQQLMDAARQQNWDPSVAALVAFPDVLNLLNNDIRWTTDLGNAFLAQQADVMAAVQVMRGRARANGRLSSNGQETVTTQGQNIVIEPANPQVIYVPVYQPDYVYGPPLWGAYPSLWYPPYFGLGVGFAWGPGIYLGGFFPGWYGWGGWGWGFGWGGGGLFVNAGFFNRWGFGGYHGYGGGYGVGGARAAWAHDPAHRMGVAYSSRAVAARYNSSRFTGNGRGGQIGAANRGGAAQAYRGSAAGRANAGRQFGSNGRSATNSFGSANRSASPGYGGRSASPAYGGRSGYGAAQGYRGSTSAQSYRGAQSYGRSSGQSYSAPRAQSYSAPRGQSYSAPRAQSYSAPRAQSYSAPRSSGGGFSGGHAASSGGHVGGGGHSGGGHHGR